MPFDAYIPVISTLISFGGLIFVAIQIRDANRQRELQSLVEILDINRQLLSLGFSHPKLFEVLEDKDVNDPLCEKRYLQLLLNQLSLSHAYTQHAVFRAELQDELHRNLVDVMGMKNMQKHWRQYGSFYPALFQNCVNGILEKKEPPKAARGNTE